MTADPRFIVTDIKDAKLRHSVQTILQAHCSQHDAQFVSGHDEVIAAIHARQGHDQMVVILEADEPGDGDVTWPGVDVLFRIRATLAAPANAVPVILLAPTDGPGLARELGAESSLALLPSVCILIQKHDLSVEQLSTAIAAARAVEPDVIDNLVEHYRDEERSRISHVYRHANIRKQMMAAARIVQGALLVGDVGPEQATRILRDFAPDDAAREQAVAYVRTMVEGGFVRPERSRRARLGTYMLLIDDEYETNGWGQALAAVFLGPSLPDARFEAVATIEDALAYLDRADQTPLVLLDLILRSEASLDSDSVIEEAVRQGETNWRRLIEAERLLPLLVFSKHGDDQRVSRKLRDLRLRYYWKDVPDDRDETRYYVKLCELIELVLNDAAVVADAEAARRVQRRLCGDVPNLEDLCDAAVGFVPCRAVGGDYYKVVRLSGRRVLILIADVAGKGLEAAMLASAFHGALQMTDPAMMRLDVLAAKLNQFMCAQGKMVTCFMGVVDLVVGEIEYVNAGHEPALLVRGAETSELGSTAQPFGLITDWPRRKKGEEDNPVNLRQQIFSGDELVVYTDGFTETRNVGGDEFGHERIRDTILATREESANAAVSALRLAVEGFSDVQSDDRTVIVLKVK